MYEGKGEQGGVLGKLEVSRGAIVWYPRNHTYGHKITWSQLDALAQGFARFERRKKRR